MNSEFWSMNKLILNRIGKNLLPAIVGMILASFSSCGSPRPYEYEIDNWTDYPMTLNYLEDGEERIMEIPADERERFFSMPGIRGGGDLGDNFLSIAGLESLELIVDPDSIRVTKELSLRGNWEFGGYLNSLEDDGYNSYVFRIREIDLE